VDLGPQSVSGLEVVKSLRDAGFPGQICVHSNRFLPEDNKRALEAGADTVLPKPMGRAHFLKLILASLPAEEAVDAGVPAQPAPLNVALVDDSLTMRVAWRTAIGKHTSHLGFRGTPEFWAACAKEAGYLDRLDVIVTDYNFAPDDPEDGGTFARALRQRGYCGLIFRASGETDLGAEIEALFDADVGKSPPKGDDFLARVAAVRQARIRG
jgi:CheY-like chemotaxis protein